MAEQHELTPAETSRAALVAALEDPVLFVRYLLGDDVTPTQAHILRSIAKPRARHAVRSCHASGKTRISADAVVWFLSRYPDGIVVTTAPTWTQVEKLLWGEIHAAVRRAKLRYPEVNKTELRLSESNYALGLSTNEGVRFQGFHAPHMLFVLDEAPGVRADVWEAIEGARAGGDVRVLAIGNPTIGSGPFYDAFTRHRAAWSTQSISGFDTPNLDGITLDELKTWAIDDPRLDENTRPYLITRRWVREKWEEWGRHGHPLWDARVMGQFPAQAEDALVALAWIEAARQRPVSDDGTPVRAGIDVAGPGEDETVLIIRQDGAVLEERWWPTPDPRGELVAALAPYRDRLEVVNVDTAGIGHYLATHLEDHKFPVVHVNVGEGAQDSERYKNLKAELYWGLRMRFEAGEVSGPFSEELVSQLSGIRWNTNARGQVEIERKEDARKRGVKSPDRAEALMLAFAMTGSNQGFLEFLKRGHQWNQAAQGGQG